MGPSATRSITLAVLATAIALVPGLALAGPAAAENPVVTMQARAANAEFLAFAPPPEGGAAAVCLVDSGVDLNPDTASNVVHREAMDGGEPSDVRSTKHGTSMAMTMGAPVNDWGGVGAWPHVRIVSVRALPPGEEAFPFHVYEQAVVRCDEASAARRIAVINLSLGGRGATPQEVARLRDAFRGTYSDGMDVVVAAGNGGGPPEYPAAVPEAFAIAGTDASGALCSFSARGQGIDQAAPGCGLDVGLFDGRPGSADGTSDSAAFVSAVLAALRSYGPNIGPLEAERLLLQTARNPYGQAVLDVEAAFRAAGLGAVVDAGRAQVPAGALAEPSPQPPSRTARPGRRPRSAGPPRPRLRRARLRGRQLTVSTAGRPRNGRLEATISYRRRGEFGTGVRTIRRRSNALRVRLPDGWRRVALRFTSLTGTSPAVVVTPRSLRRRGSNSR